MATSQQQSSVSKSELILTGSLYRVIWTISLPLILNNFIMTLYNMADAVFVGQLGTTEFAAVSFVGPVMFLFMAIGFGIQIAGTSILSQFIGKGEVDKTNEYAWHIILFTIFLGIVIGIAGFLLTPFIIQFMGGKGRFGSLAQDYLKFVFLGVPFQIVFMGFQSIMNAQGNTKATTFVNTIAAITNVILDPIFIFSRIPILNLPGLGLGVSGAALATSLSQVLLAGLGYYIMRKSSRTISLDFTRVKLDLVKFKKILKVALPSSAGQSGAAFGFVVLNSFIASYGTPTIAAFSLVNRINDMVMHPAMGIGAGLTSIVGQNMGAYKIDRIREAFHKAVKLSLLMSLTGTLLIFIFRYQLIYFFTPTAEESVVSQSLEYMFYILPTLPLMGLFSIFQGLFQGSGHTSYSMFMAIGRLWLIRIPLILVLNRFTGLGSRGIWFAMTFSNFMVIVYGFWIYRAKKWTRSVL